jgi:hypothetical protein
VIGITLVVNADFTVTCYDTDPSGTRNYSTCSFTNLDPSNGNYTLTNSWGSGAGAGSSTVTGKVDFFSGTGTLAYTGSGGGSGTGRLVRR